MIPKNFVLLTGIDEIRQAKDRIKENGDELLTNFFVEDKKLQRFIDRDDIKYMPSDKTLLVTIAHETFDQFCFYSVDADDLLARIKEIMPTLERTTTLEFFVDNRSRERLEPIQTRLNEIGFKHYKTQYRMIKVVATNEYGEIEPEWYAKPDDVDELMDMLRADFDPLCDQLPERDELLDMINNKEAIVARNGNRIAAAIIFKRQPACVYGIWWVTRPEDRKAAYGLLVGDKYQEIISKVRRQIGYANKKRTKRYQESRGAHADGFENRVLVFNR